MGDRILEGNPDRKIPFARPRRRWETGFWWVTLIERYHLQDPGVDGRIICKRIFKKWDGGYGLDSSGSGQGQVGGSRECGNEPSVSIKFREFFD